MNQPKQPYTALPILSASVVRRYRTKHPPFEALLRKLQRSDPIAAAWLAEAAEATAPGDPDTKEQLSSLALGLFWLLYEQNLVNRLHDTYAQLFNPVADTTEAPANEEG